MTGKTNRVTRVEIASNRYRDVSSETPKITTTEIAIGVRMEVFEKIVRTITRQNAILAKRGAADRVE